MGLRVGGYATIWSVEDKGNYSNVKLTTSRKNQSGQYETDFSGFVRFVGEAHKNAGSLSEKDRVKVGEFDVQNSYNKEKGVTYYNVAIFAFEPAEGKPAPKPEPPKAAEKKPAAAKKKAAAPADTDSGEDYPF